MVRIFPGFHKITVMGLDSWNMNLCPEVSKKPTAFIFRGSWCMNFEPLKMKTKRRLQLTQQRTVTPQDTETLDYITRSTSKLTQDCDLALCCM
jgi:hypothetical protein